ncbi:MAG TPA: hypothetical protein VN372_13525 [Methanospirillum sp.]|nr:hypothetical protein [Methanospirillum sp.]
MSSYTALKSLDEAAMRTRILLWPPKAGVWIRIAVIALFLGGFMMNPFKSDLISAPDPDTFLQPGLMSGYESVIISLIIVLMAGLLFYVLLSSIFQFVFVDCISSGTILIGRTFRNRMGKGLHLLLFYLCMLLLIIIASGIVVVFVILPVFLDGPLVLLTLLVHLIMALVILLILLIPVWILAILTADFVVPLMIREDCGIIDGWNYLIQIFSGRWVEAMIYTGVKIILSIIAGIILGVIVGLITILLDLPASIIGSQGVHEGISDKTVMLLIASTCVVCVISLFLLVPVITFFRYYSLIMLKELDTRYDFLTPNP